MPHSRRRFTAAAAALLGLPGLAVSAESTDFPTRLVRVVPFGTGGGPIDSIARLYAAKLQQRWGQTVIVEPKPGASGTLAADSVAKAAPDGYTVLLTLPLTHVNNAILNPKLPYDPVKDFTPLSMLATGSPLLVGAASAPFNNLKELVDFARKQKTVSYGTWGIGSAAHLFTELLKRQTGTELVHVPYKSEAAVHNDLLGGVLEFGWANPATARAKVDAGRLKVLGVAGRKRSSIFPSVPTFAEQGFQGYDIDSWIGVYAPAGTPKAVVARWTEALREITRQPDIASRLQAYGFEPLGNTQAEFMAVYKSDYPRVAELIKAAGVTAD